MCVDSTQSTGFCFSFPKGKPGQNLGGKTELDNWALVQDLYQVLAFPEAPKRNKGQLKASPPRAPHDACGQTSESLKFQNVF